VPRVGIVIALTLYSRPGCHLCDDMKAVGERVVPSIAESVTLAIVDISTDASLEAAYGLEIPVLMVNGKKAAKYRIGEDDLRRLLDTRRV
jgi:glutaredoxin